MQWNQQARLRAMGERAARELAEMAQRGEIEDIERYLADPEFMASLLEMPARAAVKLFEERRSRMEAEAALSQAREAGETDVLEKLRARRALPVSIRPEGRMSGETDYMAMSDEEFRRTRERIRREAFRGEN